MRGISEYFHSPLFDPCSIQVLNGRQVSRNCFFCSSNYSLKSVSVLLGCKTKPDSYRGTDDRLNNSSVELDQQLLRQFKLPELAQKEHSLLCFFNDTFDVR